MTVSTTGPAGAARPGSSTRPTVPVRCAISGGVATLTLDRSPRNALTAEVADALVEALRRCGADPRVRAVVLTGAGDTFSAGADLTAGPDAVRRLIEHDDTGAAGDTGYREPAGRVTAAITALPVPVIAAINGDAVGGGATITLAADVRFTADHARFGFPFTRLGVCPEGGSTYYLPRLVGHGAAADWLLSGRLFSAPEALASGLVSRVLAAADLLGAAQEWAAGIARGTAPTAVAVTRALLTEPPDTPEAACASESAAIVDLSQRPDCAEGVAAFLERRAPQFAERSTDGRLTAR